MQSTNELIEEAKKKRTLATLKPTSLPESCDTINTSKTETQSCGIPSLPEEYRHRPERNNSSIHVLPENLINSGTEKHETQISAKEELQTQQADKKQLPENHNTKKVKVTVYITEESWEDFNHIYGKRILDKRKTDKGDLINEAIALLKEKETTRNP